MDALTWYADIDGALFGDAVSTANACAVPAGYVADSTYCDGLASETNPTAVEICDSADNDCDGEFEEGVGFTLYSDLDGYGYGYGYGDVTVSSGACDAPPEFISNALDWDDLAATKNPSVITRCDCVDSNCDGDGDQGGAIDATVWCRDADGDLYGDTAV